MCCSWLAAFGIATLKTMTHLILVEVACGNSFFAFDICFFWGPREQSCLQVVLVGAKNGSGKFLLAKPCALSLRWYWLAIGGRGCLDQGGLLIRGQHLSIKPLTFIEERPFVLAFDFVDLCRLV